MKTFRWTIPEIGLSRAEEEAHQRYAPAARGIHVDRKKALTASELKFIEKWGQERVLGHRAFRKKILLRSCLALSIITGTFLFMKITGVVEKETTLFTSAVMLTFITQMSASMPSWKKNEKRYKTLMEKLDS